MLRLGLTGGVAAGKSTVAQMFADEGAAVFDADRAVHALYAPGGAAVAPVAAAFPNVVAADAVDRQRLGARIARDPTALSRLEALVHPLVEAEEEAFVVAAALAGVRIAVLDIPLLFETGGEKRVDAVVVVTTPADVQRARVRARGGMSDAELDALMARQMPDAEKRRRAHFVIDTGQPMEATRCEVRAVIRALAARAAS